MSMTKRDAMDLARQYDRLRAIGISYEDADALHRISMTLRRWFERECGVDSGCIERDEQTGQTYWYDSFSSRRSPIADKETGARKRLGAIMARYPGLTAYVQGDPRGCSLYILTAEQTDGSLHNHALDAIYTRGVAVA